ncbi:MAG: cupin domain-containing protein [Pseudomonadota bacterium]
MTQKFNLTDLPNLLDKPGNSMRRFGGDNVMLQVATSRAGDGFDPHSHHNEQLVMVLEGRMRLDIGDPPAPVELGPGDCLVIPPHTPHGGETLEDCKIVDAFSPPRTTVLGEEEPQ